MCRIMLLLPIVLGVVASTLATIKPPLETVYEWKFLEYKFLNAKHRLTSIKNGDYNFKKGMMIDVDRARDGRTFVTVIRSKGVPSSLNVVTSERGRGGPLLKPYPNWTWARNENCTGITSVYRIAIDHCDRLWVLDTGKIGAEQVCPAKLLAFDLTTDTLIKKVEIPDSIASSSKGKSGLLVTPVVETYDSRCTKTYVYMADIHGYGLLVYDGEKVWRLESKVYEPHPDYLNFTIDGESFKLNDGVVGLALSPDYGEESRSLYFKSLCSTDMFVASTQDLKNSRHQQHVKYYKAEGFLPSQSVAQAFSAEGTLFFGLTSETAIGCWHHYRHPTKKNVGIAVKDKRRLQFASGVKIVPTYFTGFDEELWVVTNRFQKMKNGSQNFKKINFRILRGIVRQLVAGTICDAPYRGEPRHYSIDGRPDLGLFEPVPDEEAKP